MFFKEGGHDTTLCLDCMDTGFVRVIVRALDLQLLMRCNLCQEGENCCNDLPIFTPSPAYDKIKFPTSWFFPSTDDKKDPHFINKKAQSWREKIKESTLYWQSMQQHIQPGGCNENGERETQNI